MSYYLCVTVFTKRLNVGIVNEKGEISFFKYVYYDDIPEKKDLIQTIVKMAKEAIAKYSPDSCTASFPGIVDNIRGVCYRTNGQEIPFKSELQKKLNIPIFIDNDSNLSAIGEKYFGSMKYVDNFFYLNIGWGVGGALYINNNLYRGVHNGAGEIGHIIIDEGGAACTCGNNGCLETVASSGNISQYYGMLTETPNPPHYKDVANLARQGDIYAMDAFSRAGFAIGKALSYMINLFNITHIVIGGTVGIEFDLLYPSIMEAVSHFALKISNYDIQIVKTELGYDATLLGCAANCICCEKNIDKYEKNMNSD